MVTFVPNMLEEFSGDESPKDLQELLGRFEEMLRLENSYYFEEDDIDELVLHFTENKDFTKAIEAVQLGLRQHPFSTGFLVRKAQLLGASNQVTKAFEALAEAENFDPNNEEIYITRGTLYSHLNEHDKAISSFRTALKYSTDHEEILLLLSIEYANKKDFDKAIACLKKVLALNPENELALYELAWCFDESGRIEDSIQYYNDYLDKDPYSVSGWFNLGITYSKLQFYEEAIDAFDYSIAIQDNFSSAYYNKANALAELGKYRESIEVYKQSFEFEDPDEFTNYNIGECHEKLGETKEAAYFYTKSIQHDPEFSPAYAGLGVVANLEGKYQESIHQLRRALDLEPRNGEYWFIIADFHFKAGFIEEAEFAYWMTIGLEPDNWEARLDLSLLLYSEARLEKCLTMLREGTVLTLQSAPIWYRLAAISILAGHKKEGINALEEALTLDFADHKLFFEFEPKLENDPEIINLIESFRPL
jgi:tetratricopeptide (TPR) repeat protein